MLGGILAALYFYGGKLISNKSDTDQNQTNQDNQTQPDEPSGLSVKPTPDADDLINLVVARFADEGNRGDLKLSTVDATDTGELTETKVLTLESKREDGVTAATVSPNGQFVALVEHEEPTSGPVDGVTNVLSLVELGSGDQTVIDDDFKSTPPAVVWTPDSEYLIYSGTNADTGIIESLNVYNLESGIVGSSVMSLAEGEEFSYVPVAATNNDLFVLKVEPPEGPGELGTLSLSDSGEVGLDFEKIIDLSMASRGFDVSSDGKQIIFARGTGESLGDAENGPFILELLDRGTGEIEELRTSSSEGYKSPKFTEDGESIIYGAASGIWMLELESGDRTQLVESSEFDNLIDEVVEPLFISPNGEIVLVGVPVEVGPKYEFYAVPTDGENQPLGELGQIEATPSDEDGALDVFGWTI